MEKIVGDLFEIIKELVKAHKARGEALDKSVAERLERAEQGLYASQKSAHDRVMAELAERLTEDAQSKFDLEPLPASAPTKR